MNKLNIYNRINYNILQCNNIQGDVLNYIAMQLCFTSILYLIYSFYIFTFFYSKIKLKNYNFLSINPKQVPKVNKKQIFIFYNLVWKLLTIYYHYYIKIKNCTITIYICNSLLYIKYKINHIINNKKNNKQIYFINKGDIILTLNNYTHSPINLIDIQYDFILYKNNETELYKIITKNNYEIENISMIDKSNIKFFVACIQIYKNSFEFEKYDLNLNNFMIVDNQLLSMGFIIWYLKHYHNKKYNFLVANDLYYKIEIIDNNVNKLTLYPDNFIVIHKNDYSICNYYKKLI